MINKEKLKLCLLGIQPGSTVPPTRWSIILLLGFEYYFLIDNIAFLEHFAFVYWSWLMGKRFVRNLMWKENILSRNCSASIIFFPYVLIMISIKVFSCGVGAIVLRIAAFQAVDPGSIPDRRTMDHGSSDHFVFSYFHIVLFIYLFIYLFGVLLSVWNSLIFLVRDQSLMIWQ